jgi:hypothetical protein
MCFEFRTENFLKYFSVENAKLVDGSDRLKSLCTEFESKVIGRSKRIRDQNPCESSSIPDYRKLLQTEKFSNFTTCTCDHETTAKQTSRLVFCVFALHSHKSQFWCPKENCSKHDKKSTRKRKISTDSSSSTASSFSSHSSSTSRCSSSSDEEDLTSKRTKKAHGTSDDDQFDDIRSMEINRKMNHPQRLHSNLSFNEPDQTNDGPLCKCKLKNTTFGTRHQIYYGETAVAKCADYGNNADRLFHYRMTITPFKNFFIRAPTYIIYDKQEYLFEGLKKPVCSCRRQSDRSWIAVVFKVSLCSFTNRSL